jgi:hypothetical protein
VNVMAFGPCKICGERSSRRRVGCTFIYLCDEHNQEVKQRVRDHRAADYYGRTPFRPARAYWERRFRQ